MLSLYDVFSAIRDDEGDHVSTMEACLDPDVAVNAPSIERKFILALSLAALVGTFVSGGNLLDLSGIIDDASSGDLSDLGTDVVEVGGSGVLLDFLKKGAVNVFEVLTDILPFL